MFHDYQDISIPFPDYQISADEVVDITIRIYDLFKDNAPYMDLLYSDIEEKYYTDDSHIYLINKSEDEYLILYYKGLCWGDSLPAVVHLTKAGDYYDKSVMGTIIYIVY